MKLWHHNGCCLFLANFAFYPHPNTPPRHCPKKIGRKYQTKYSLLQVQFGFFYYTCAAHLSLFKKKICSIQWWFNSIITSLLLHTDLNSSNVVKQSEKSLSTALLKVLPKAKHEFYFKMNLIRKGHHRKKKIALTSGSCLPGCQVDLENLINALGYGMGQNQCQDFWGEHLGHKPWYPLYKYRHGAHSSLPFQKPNRKQRITTA